VRTLCAVFVSVCCCVPCLQPAVKAETKPKASEKLAQAESLTREQGQLGEKSLRILVDTRQPKSARLEAAQILGKLRYAPAIPDLITRLDMIDPDALGVKESDPAKGMPCFAALAEIGAEARGPILAAALKEREPDRYYLFVSLLRRPKFAATRHEAYQQLIGIGFQSHDKRTRERVVQLIREISDDFDKSVDVPEDWVKDK
jgi:hypothetical protein